MTICWGNHKIMLPVILFITYFLSIYLFKNIENSEILKKGMYLCLPFPILCLITCIWYEDFSRGLPYIIFIPFFTFFGYLYVKYQKKYSIVLSLILISFVSLILFPNYFVWYYNHDAEKNVNYHYIDVINFKQEQVVLDKSKIVVLDFWSTNCGICFKKFPDLENIYAKYKNNNKVAIYAVHVPTKGDVFNKSIKLLDKYNYHFPKLYAKSLQQVEDSLKFNTFPHLMIIKNGKIRYDGFLVTAEESVIYNIDDEIDKLLKEK